MKTIDNEIKILIFFEFDIETCRLLNNTFLVDQVYVSQIKIEDHFLLFEYMSAHPVGRSVAWKFYQNNYLKLATR